MKPDNLRFLSPTRREKPLQQFRLRQASVLGLRQREQRELWRRSLVSFANDNRHGYNPAEHSLEIGTRLVRGGSTLPPHFLDNLQVRQRRGETVHRPTCHRVRHPFSIKGPDFLMEDLDHRGSTEL